MSEALEPPLDASDIQGNIIPGFNRTSRYLAAFSCIDKTRLQRALAALHPRITTLLETLEHRDDRKRAFLNNEAAPQRPELWLNLALGVNATNALGATAVAELDDDDGSFVHGMSPGLVGDPHAEVLPDGSPNPANRRNWVVGSPMRRVDLLLIFAADKDIEQKAASIIDEIATLLESPPVYREQGQMLDGETEHFGFRDGISQPGVRGRIVKDGVERLITTRYGVPSRQGVDYGKPGQPLVWPGQFLTGQPTSKDDRPSLPPELTDGSFLVFRRLQQDVRAFYDDTDLLARKLSSATGLELSGSNLRTRIVGRFQSGASLMRHQHELSRPEGPNEINYFEFGTALPAINLSDGAQVAGSAADPDMLRGRRCPVWAHTRKVNPRDQGTNRGGPLETIGFQMLRRGIPFGPHYDHSNQANPENALPRGLLFMSYQRNIALQFEILNHDWMNNRDAPQAGGFDLLVGQNVPEDGGGQYAPKAATYFGPSINGSDTGTSFDTPRQWIIPTGGAFLFAPSLAFVKKFGSVAVA